MLKDIIYIYMLTIFIFFFPTDVIFSDSGFAIQNMHGIRLNRSSRDGVMCMMM
jgi:hypothetical protein